MLFNSVEFIFLFLPVTVIGYYALTHNGYYRQSKLWLIIASLFFYAWWNTFYLLLILGSIAVNYSVAVHMARQGNVDQRKLWLILGVVFNVALLGYFKYADFFISNVNQLFQADYNLLHIILPLGISFFTFQQIAYLVDTYKRIVVEFDFFNYALFVCFFPQLVAGPIVHHREIMPQLLDRERAFVNWNNIVKGVFVFNMGLAKKIVIADTLGKVVNTGYAGFDLLSTSQAWITSFFYTMQLYFDFSGYSDMAIGLGLLFNIVIPVNFWSPHKAPGIQEFYRRWHITLSRFLREYVYIPIGGNRRSEVRTAFNVFLTFVVGGFWHGANWTFVIWGALNGAAMVVQRLWHKTKFAMPYAAAVTIMFVFVLIVRVFFRADSYSVALTVLRAMVGIHPEGSHFTLINQYYDTPLWIAAVVLLFAPNSNQIAERFNTGYRFAAMMVAMLFVNLTFLNSAIKHEFIYFNF
jgi:alginate O-acetyltransferase complex protein AlgI